MIGISSNELRVDEVNRTPAANFDAKAELRYNRRADSEKMNYFASIIARTDSGKRP